mmetsp:Transcript_7326/g.26815  ORF Transcript_7326/g.26815 Transcript_7326/m.26815 type:complete len:204 (-) Transcript_7326:249-860(-)
MSIFSSVSGSSIAARLSSGDLGFVSPPNHPPLLGRPLGTRGGSVLSRGSLLGVPTAGRFTPGVGDGEVFPVFGGTGEPRPRLALLSSHFFRRASSCLKLLSLSDVSHRAWSSSARSLSRSSACFDAIAVASSARECASPCFSLCASISLWRFSFSLRCAMDSRTFWMPVDESFPLSSSLSPWSFPTHTSARTHHTNRMPLHAA